MLFWGDVLMSRVVNVPCCSGLIQHRAVAWIYIVLELCVPALLYVAINYTPSLHSMMVRVWPLWEDTWFTSSSIDYPVRLS